MLRITPCISATAAKRYFQEALRTGDYFFDRVMEAGQELLGNWGGKGAERLGLRGEVTEEAFNRLCDNHHPTTGEKLTPRSKDNRRVAYDFTFSVPKSVSLAAELSGDNRIMEALHAAVRETMTELEGGMNTRVRKGGQNADRPTGNMVWAEYIHRTSRPVEAVPDPHLHLHCVAFNATWDEVEQRWKAGEFSGIKRDAPYYQAACDARMAARLMALGYEVERRGTGWELAAIPDSMVRKFSRRTEEIEQAIRDQGITDPARKAEQGKKTRSRKQKSLTMEGLRKEWHGRLTAEERKALKRLQAARIEEVLRKRDRIRAVERALTFAIDHCFERASVVPEKRLLAAALVQGIGLVTPEVMKAHAATLAERKELLLGVMDGQLMATTADVLREERMVLNAIRAGRGQHAPLKLHHQIRDAELSAEQRMACEHLLASTDSVLLLNGKAGVGKTKLMQEVVKAINSEGRSVQAAAPTGMATHEVLRRDGFRNAETVARVLASPTLAEKLKGQVLWVDEAGLLSMRDMAKLVRLAEKSKARLLLSGDTRQHRSVMRGDALRLIESECGLEAATLKEIRRQKPADYRKAAEALSRGDLLAGFKELDGMGAIREADEQQRPQLVAECFVDSLRKGQTTLVVAPTHLEGRMVTDAVRVELRLAGLIHGEEKQVSRLQNRQLTEAERGSAHFYRKGDVLVFHRAAHGGFRATDRAEVVSKDINTVTVKRSRDGKTARVPLHGPSAFQVFERQQLTLAAGDRIRITHPGRTRCNKHRLCNGAIYLVESIDDRGVITLQNGWKLPREFGHIAHGYAVTSDASQGRTVDHIIIAQSEWSSAASNLQQWYTSITRGRCQITVVTDDKFRLLEAIARDNSRLTGTEFLREALMMPPRQRGAGQRQHAATWAARENTRRMKEEINRHYQRQHGEHKRQRRRERGGWSRERGD